MSNINDIKNSIKESGKKVFWFDSSGKLLISGEDKASTKNQIKKLKLKDGSKLFRLIIEFHSGQKAEHPGKICVITKTFIFENDSVKDNNWKENSNGYVWFDDDFLLRRGWKNYYINTIVNKIIKGSLKFKFGFIFYKQIE